MIAPRIFGEHLLKLFAGRQVIDKPGRLGRWLATALASRGFVTRAARHLRGPAYGRVLFRKRAAERQNEIAVADAGREEGRKVERDLAGGGIVETLLDEPDQAPHQADKLLPIQAFESFGQLTDSGREERFRMDRVAIRRKAVARSRPTSPAEPLTDRLAMGVPLGRRQDADHSLPRPGARPDGEAQSSFGVAVEMLQVAMAKRHRTGAASDRASAGSRNPLAGRHLDRARGRGERTDPGRQGHRNG